MTTTERKSYRAWLRQARTCQGDDQIVFCRLVDDEWEEIELDEASEAGRYAIVDRQTRARLVETVHDGGENRSVTRFDPGTHKLIESWSFRAECAERRAQALEKIADEAKAALYLKEVELLEAKMAAAQPEIGALLTLADRWFAGHDKKALAKGATAVLNAIASQLSDGARAELMAVVTKNPNLVEAATKADG